MRDIYQSIKGYNYTCFYWKRNTTQPMDNEEIVHNQQPSGIFHAKIITSKSSDKNDLVGVFRVDVEGMTIETRDIVDLKKDDLIQFDNQIWLVGRVNTDPIQKNAEFGRYVSNKTTIEINRG